MLEDGLMVPGLTESASPGSRWIRRVSTRRCLSSGPRLCLAAIFCLSVDSSSYLQTGQRDRPLNKRGTLPLKIKIGRPDPGPDHVGHPSHITGVKLAPRGPVVYPVNASCWNAGPRDDWQRSARSNQACCKLAVSGLSDASWYAAMKTPDVPSWVPSHHQPGPQSCCVLNRRG
jgi:hypothetical protein